MRKDRLILLLLLCTFALMGAECSTFDDDDDEEERFPNRAQASNELLRHYYDSNTFPKNMTAEKIPEGDDFDDDELVLEIAMGGSEIVDDVRVTLFLAPPPSVNLENLPDVQCRVRAPDGTRSSWQFVDFIYPGAGLAGEGYVVDTQFEVRFANAFDGVTSGGFWEIELRDPVEDDDGRCLFRNATLRLNGGLPSTATSGNETATLDLEVGPYDAPIPELSGGRMAGDLAHVGTEAPLRAQFTFTGGFNVRSHAVSLTFRAIAGADPNLDLVVAVVSPSGAWEIGGLPEPTSSSTSGDETFTWTLFDFGDGQANPDTGNSYVFLGEPAAGTWTLLIWDNRKDRLSMYLAPEQGTDPITPDVEASFTLG